MAAPVVGRTVVIVITGPDGAQIQTVLTTDALGRLPDIVVEAPLAGAYNVSATFAGDAEYLPASAQAGYTALATVPSAPQNLTAKSGDGLVELTWEAPVSDGGSPITSYDIYRGEESGKEVLIATVRDGVLTHIEPAGG